MLNALAAGDKSNLSMALKRYKTRNGTVDFDLVLSIPSDERLPNLASQYGYKRIHGVLVAAVQMAMESLNLSATLSAEQIFELVDAILDSATEDFLAMQDVMLFLQKLVRGEMGPLYSQMDIAKFMELFERYREERFKAFKKIEEERHLQFKSSGPIERWSEMNKGNQQASMQELMEKYNLGKI